ncbi:MAG TPA: hypothetical protein VGM73_11065 [Candidatus Didemnitutus sp.]|jgi:hypothetical protein
MKTRTYLPWFVCLLACLLGWTAYAQNSRGAAPRPAWDYKLIIFNSENLIGGHEAEMFDDGVALPSPVPGGLRKLKELGAQGWELVTVINESLEGRRLQTKYYLKRPN